MLPRWRVHCVTLSLVWDSGCRHHATFFAHAQTAFAQPYPSGTGLENSSKEETMEMTSQNLKFYVTYSRVRDKCQWYSGIWPACSGNVMSVAKAFANAPITKAFKRLLELDVLFILWSHEAMSCVVFQIPGFQKSTKHMFPRICWICSIKKRHLQLRREWHCSRQNTIVWN